MQEGNEAQPADQPGGGHGRRASRVPADAAHRRRRHVAARWPLVAAAHAHPARRPRSRRAERTAPAPTAATDDAKRTAPSQSERRHDGSWRTAAQLRLAAVVLLGGHFHFRYFRSRHPDAVGGARLHGHVSVPLVSPNVHGAAATLPAHITPLLGARPKQASEYLIIIIIIIVIDN